MSDHETLQLTTRIDVAPSVLYRALTYSQALVDWFCDDARSNATEGGRLYLWWRDGTYIAGEYTRVNEDEEVELTWIMRGSPTPKQVRYTIAPLRRGCELTLHYKGFSEEMREKAEGHWTSALENLKYVLEEGDDRRQSQRPMIGLYFGAQVDETNAEQFNMPLPHGVQIAGMVPGSAGEAVGLKAGDILVAIDDHEAHDWTLLGKAIGHYKIGDEVTLTFYRDGEKKTLPLTFASPPAQPVPAERAEFARVLRDEYDRILGEVETLLEGASEEQAARRPGEKEWSAQHVLAHMIGSEIGNQNTIAVMLEQGYDGGVYSNNDLYVESMVEQLGGTQALVDRLRETMDITVRMVENLPNELLDHKGSYHALGRTLIHGAPRHTDFHLQQIKRALAPVAEPA